MNGRQRGVLIFLIIVLGSALLAATTLIDVSVRGEMTPEWTTRNENHFTKLAVSAGGEYIAAAANTTNTLYIFHGNELLWTSSVGQVRSLAVSANGTYVAVGTKRGFYSFDRQSPTPQVEFHVGCEDSLVAVSASGNITAFGTTSRGHDDDLETKLYLFEKGNLTPGWNNTFPGVLESLSISDDGNYIVASTSHPGTLLLFSRAQANPLWSHNFGERSGGAKMASNGNYIVAVGGNQTGEKNLRVYRFRRQIWTPNYMKVIAELPSTSGISISANGSIFAISYTNSNTSSLMLFNLELPPYGYGPGSVLKVPLPSRTGSMSMSSDGSHIIVGTDEGIFTYKYSNRQLTLTKQYTVNTPSIVDLAISVNGHFIIAAATGENSAGSTIYLFDNFKEPQDNSAEILLQLVLPAIIVATALATTIYVLGRKEKRSQVAPVSSLRNHNLYQQATSQKC